MDTSNMYVALYDEATDTVRFGLAFEDGNRIDVDKDAGWQPRKTGRGRTEFIIRARNRSFCPTMEESRAWYAWTGHEEYVGAFGSWLGVPMMLGEKVLGVIATFHPTREYVYSGDDLNVLQRSCKSSSERHREHSAVQSTGSTLIALRKNSPGGWQQRNGRHLDRLPRTWRIV